MIKNPHRLNLLIHLAAFVSPIGLLTGVQLCGRDYERYSVFLVSLAEKCAVVMSLGN